MSAPELAFGCPYCGAEPGFLCTTKPDGKPLRMPDGNNFHKSRKELAAQEEQK